MTEQKARYDFMTSSLDIPCAQKKSGGGVRSIRCCSSPLAYSCKQDTLKCSTEPPKSLLSKTTSSAKARFEPHPAPRSFAVRGHRFPSPQCRDGTWRALCHSQQMSLKSSICGRGMRFLLRLRRAGLGFGDLWVLLY